MSPSCLLEDSFSRLFRDINETSSISQRWLHNDSGASHRLPISKASYFVTLSIRKQLEYLLSIKEVANHLNYREERRKVSGDVLEDILERKAYQSIEVDGQKLLGSNNFTYSFSIDGCKPTKGSNTNIYPLFLRINELPPQLR
ncbi:Putative bifunctional phosphatase/peptidyl-prolyl cis-trans isomerase [Frankliniella fusca]|uniref:Bifunctional phosphatase/peptidyl-prolyl cis-trans isomerase n=1 Tax=Frankliniella fusca TaxID=407009 RepID=A0AAE1GYT3_9NEOP|nr:Putative bifunctional phosphatase/peptidyl-prolyl cis-trans isomerase [Frankliniella fusca]